MNITLLNERLSILKQKTIFDEVGNRSLEWVEMWTCYGYVSESSVKIGDELVTSVSVRENEVVTFTIRYCKAVANLQATENRVLFHGKPYNILEVNHMNYRKKFLKLKCQRVER